MLSPQLENGHVRLFNLGKYGVEIFFIISGYVIVNSLRRHHDMASFAIDRIARIYPLFFILHLVVFTAGPLVEHKFFAGIDVLGWLYLFSVNLFLLPGVFDFPLAQLVAWSLSYEVAFYGLAMAAMVLWRRQHGALWLAGWIVWTSSACGLIWFHPRTAFFLPGVAAAAYTPILSRAVARIPAILAVAGFGCFLWFWPRLGFASGATLADCGANVSSWGCYSAGLAGGSLFFWHVALRSTWLGSMFGSRAIVAFGDLSYSFYLIHLFVVVGLRPIFRRWIFAEAGPLTSFWIFGAAALTITTVLSLLSRRWIEIWAGERTKAFLRKRFL